MGLSNHKQIVPIDSLDPSGSPTYKRTVPFNNFSKTCTSTTYHSGNFLLVKALLKTIPLPLIFLLII